MTLAGLFEPGVLAAWWSAAVWLVYLAAAAAALALAFWQLRAISQAGKVATASGFALALSGCWALSMIGIGADMLPTRLLSSAAYLGWLWLLGQLFADDARDPRLAPVRPVVAALAFVELLQILVAVASAANLAGAGLAEADGLLLRFAMTFRLLFCIGALVLLHNLYAGAAQHARQALRWPTAALAAMWLYDLNYYTIGYLAQQLPQVLGDLRGAVLLAAVVLLGLGNLGRQNELKFSPSRSFAFQSISLMLIGAYLLAMVVIAQALRYIGRDQGNVLLAVFVATAIGASIAVLRSGKLRAWLRVMLSKHLFQHRYDYRSEWIRFTETIGRGGPDAPPLHERIVQAAADITDSPAGLLLIPREGGGLELAARWQWPGIDVPGEALGTHAAAFFDQRQFIIDLDDVRSGAAPEVPAALRPAWLIDQHDAWAIVPLLHYGRLAGVVVLARSPVARRLDWEDFDLLRVAGRQLASYLAEQASHDALGEAQKFDEFNRRFAFVMHDIKNLASQLSLLAHNAQAHAEKPEFREDMLITLRNSADKLQALLTRLGRYGAQGGTVCETIDLTPLLSTMAARFAGKHEVIAVNPQAVLAQADADALEQALGHLVQNAVEASPPHLPVLIDARREGDCAVIEVIDSGCGMSPDFLRSRLFKPFHSSKTGGFGIGAFEARELVRAMGGQLEVESREGLGTRFAVRLAAGGEVQLMRALETNGHLPSPPPARANVA